ncbi:hypothetical protein L914_03614 [Phytophthora nicotianae]|uniref:Uncharacterized protein n=1 Tax=Phytophthora nicotianae TaxID=4792 RepID=W2NW78_PHYNI|nr:hypothetical protein L914_03614 [Phytophthora nicotianae]
MDIKEWYYGQHREKQHTENLTKIVASKFQTKLEHQYAA